MTAYTKMCLLPVLVVSTSNIIFTLTIKRIECFLPPTNYLSIHDRKVFSVETNQSFDMADSCSKHKNRKISKCVNTKNLFVYLIFAFSSLKKIIY